LKYQVAFLTTRLENNYLKKTRKFTNMQRINNMLLKQTNNKTKESKKKSKEKFKNTLRKQKWKYNMAKSVGCSKSSSEKEIHSNKC